ncbi:MAG TPA: tRNA lysidine(34) synthetase TilS [Sphingobacterium sp.]|nr:tRNA lysidine(34) synthetase TilS [Sphingobacterium sp.]
MEIVARFCAFIEEKKLLHKDDRVLLAISGGRDSMLMLWLFHSSGIYIEVAHCNFSLRGSESDADEQLVRDYCITLGVPLHVKRFDTEAFANENKISIQMAARELRYKWFEELAMEVDCDVIAIAQHKNDHVETVLLNLVRGTGLVGLQGILPKRGRIIRPLLFLDSKEITTAVQQLGMAYRDDASNFSTKYARNKIRLDIIPQFEEIHPRFIDMMEENIARFQDANAVLQLLVTDLRGKLFIPNGPDRWAIDKSNLLDKDLALLYYLFEPFGFTTAVLKDLKNALGKESGRLFESSTHQLLLDRETIFLQPTPPATEQSLRVDDGCTEAYWQHATFQLLVSDDTTIVRDASIAKLDRDKLIFPLRVRNWREGDYFHPLGMKGKKKLSDFFIDKKISLFDKKNIPIWLNGNGDILWVGGHQIDDRYKITENTQKVLTLVYHKG